MSNLFEFENFGTDGNVSQMEGAPRLVKPGAKNANQSNESRQYIATESKDFSTIDVVRDFQWTTTPPSVDKIPGGRHEVPVINLREKRLKTNALLAQVAYYTATLAGAATDAISKINNLPPQMKSMIGLVAGGLAGSGSAKFLGNIGLDIGSLGKLASLAGGGAAGAVIASNEQIAGATTDIFSSIGKSGLQELDNLPPELTNALSIPSLNSSVLRPYEGLYLTEDTKFVYSFPYLENDPNYVENAFGDDSGAFRGQVPGLGSPGELVSKYRTQIQTFAALTNITQPGVYIEKPKFFQFSDQGEEISFSFPLINTGHSKWDDVVKNWQLLFMLIYQNRPNRRSRDLIDPPCIYEVNIPGIKYLPYAYISNLSIEFLGNRRQQKIEIPGVNGSPLQIDTIIPDAYNVKITVTGLVAEAQNMLFAMLTDKQTKITTSEIGNNSIGSFISQAAERGKNRNNFVREISTSLDGGGSIPSRGSSTTPGTTP